MRDADVADAATPDADAATPDADAATLDADAATPDAGSACATACSNPHGTAECDTGSCVLSCEIGFEDCDGDPANGCEANTGELTASCGGCDLLCSNDHGVASCSEGLCAPACATGYDDCDGDADNGCETSLFDVLACGACGNVCSNPHGATACPSGVCVPTCAAGHDDCDGNPDNGCETDIFNDPDHCGSCGGACGSNGQICVDGICQASPCAAGLGECDGDLGVTCETDLNSDVNHCRFCGNPCVTANGTPSCDAGACAIDSCNPGYDDCDGDLVDCDTNLTTSTLHCGACNNACTNAHGSTRCTGSTCEPTCSNGWADCDGDADNGCETSLTTVSDCNGCGLACTPQGGGTPMCAAGVCDNRCDLTGTFALRVWGTGSWPRGEAIAAGSGTFEFWMKVDAVHTGNSVSVQLSECGRTFPPFSTFLISETYFQSLPNSLFDSGGLPVRAGTLALTDSSPDSGLSLPPMAMELGVQMSDPVNDSWPSRASGIPAGNRRDMDGDGKPGVTGPFVDAGGYDYPRTSSNFFPYNRADRAYLAARMAFSLSGSLNTCSQSSGSANVIHNNLRVYGCRRSGGGDCSGSEGEYIDRNSHSITMGSSSYELRRIGDGASCAAVRDALP